LEAIWRRPTPSPISTGLNQVDTAVEEAAKRGRTNAALSAIEGQRKALRASSRQNAPAWPPKGAGSRSGRTHPPCHELVGSNADSERAIRWLIAFMVPCCDQLAIALTAAASARRN
jgi:hypothetical protein